MPDDTGDNFDTDLVDFIRSIVLILDTEGRIQRCNPYFETLTGYRCDEVVGKDWFETFIPTADQAALRGFFSTVLTEGINDGYTNVIVKKNGEHCLVEWHSKRLDGPDGNTTGLVCAGFDVTERNALAIELQQAKEAALSAAKIKSRFLAAASHDLRQPLQSLGLYLSALTRQTDEAKKADITRKMRQSLDTMGELLDALLDISKLDGGSVTGSKRDFPLQVLLDRIITDNAQQASEKGLQLKCAATDCTVFTDPGLLERIVENFVTNAIRYTEQGEVSITCTEDDGSVRIAVHDTGIGVPEDQIEKVFEEYFQLENQVRDRRKGLGLGLAIVKHISRILEHPLEVSSQPGHGSTFTVIVPLGAAPAIETDTAAQSPLKGKQAPVVLFIDDDPTIIDATTMLLDTSDMIVHSALSGEEALDIIEGGIRPDVVVSDYRLPGYNGVEVVRRVRAATDPNLPTILMTGDTSATEIHRADLAHCTVLHKPVDTERLITLIEQLVV